MDPLPVEDLHEGHGRQRGERASLNKRHLGGIIHSMST
jgi:hypothetical protein